MKVCTKCRVSHCETLFHKDKNRKDGMTPWCKVCVKENSLNWRNKNLGYSRKVSLDYYYDNKEVILKQRISQGRLWRKNNPDKHCAKAAAYRSRKLRAEPKWLSEEQKAHMKRTYALSRIVTEATGKKYHVDHIVPLKGENICGLHVPWNLQVIPAEVNLSKGNSFGEANV